MGAQDPLVTGRFTGNASKKNSRSRFRFRPPLRPTFGFRLQPPGGASTYLRSVLRASRTLCVTPLAGQGAAGEIVRNLRGERSNRQGRPLLSRVRYAGEPAWIHVRKSSTCSLGQAPSQGISPLASRS